MRQTSGELFCRGFEGESTVARLMPRELRNDPLINHTARCAAISELGRMSTTTSCDQIGLVEGTRDIPEVFPRTSSTYTRQITRDCVNNRLTHLVTLNYDRSILTRNTYISPLKRASTLYLD